MNDKGLINYDVHLKCEKKVFRKANRTDRWKWALEWVEILEK